MLNILFICTGNTCRSPMAEALFKHELSKNKLPFPVTVSSAGLSAYAGERASLSVQHLLEARGIDINNHVATKTDREMIDNADLIFVMTGDHLRQTVSQFPQATGKTYLLKEFAEETRAGSDIEDPLGSTLEKYHLVLEEIEVCIKKIMLKLKEGCQE